MGALLTPPARARAAGPESPATAPDGQPHFAPKARSVIWIFLSGGYSHVETFDPKPALNTHAGKTFDKTSFPNPLLSPGTRNASAPSPPSP